MPALKLPHPLHHMGALSGGRVCGQAPEPAQPILAIFKVRLDLFLEKSGRQRAQPGFSLIVVAAGTVAVAHLHRPSGTEEFQSLAGGTLADVEPLGNLIQTEGDRRNVKQAVDLADGFRQAHDLRQPDKEVDRLQFKRSQPGERTREADWPGGGYFRGVDGHEQQARTKPQTEYMFNIF